jgi:hypothetical protein
MWHFLIVFENSPNCHKWNPNTLGTWQVIIFQFLNASTFTRHFHLFWFLMNVLSFRHPHRRAHRFWTPIKICVLPVIRSSEALCNIVEVSVAFFPSFKAKFDVSTLLFQVCYFLGTPKSQMAVHILVLNKTSLYNHTRYSHVGSSERLCKLDLHLLVEACASSSSGISQSVRKLFDFATCFA